MEYAAPAVNIHVLHVAGAHKGRLEEFEPTAGVVTIGRHPEARLRFDAFRDLDASARHAELVPPTSGEAWRLVDVGSANGTFVDGTRISSFVVPQAQPVLVEFGAGGPLLQIYCGQRADVAGLPTPLPLRRARRANRRRQLLLAGLVLAILLAVSLLTRWIIIAP